jgi:hypothetical protein
MTTTSPLPPLVAYYGTLTDTTQDDFVVSRYEAELIIPSLAPVPVVAMKSGEYQGDYVVLVAVPYVLPSEMRDDEFLFDLECA